MNSEVLCTINTMMKTLHVEIVQRKESRASKECIKEMVHSYLSNFASLNPGSALNVQELDEKIELRDHIQNISFCDVDQETEVLVADVEFVFHVFKLDTFGAETDTMTDTTSGEEFAAADVWALPAEEFHGLWESLVYDSRLKEDIVRFVETAFDFADRGVDPNIVGWNRVVLLHGPPGTGKTSLCRALAQKLSIRFGERFPRARLIEINAHGLFSKWFAESGKLVARLFDRVGEIVEDRRLLACILVDEVESLAHARRAAVAGLEPSDSIRAVNALLTQLDKLRRQPNALVLTTSNATGAVDVAFIDRADIKRRVGPPSERAAYEILRSCCAELMARGVVTPRESVFAWRVLEGSRFTESAAAANSLRLREVAAEAAAAGVSARTLRRLPFLASAALAGAGGLARFVAGLQGALRDQLRDAALLLEDHLAGPRPRAD